MSAPETLWLSLDLLSLASSARQQDHVASVYTDLDLDPTRNEIRLLQILPKISDDTQEQIRCKLTVHSLDDKPSYTALSYVWGDPEQTQPVMVNGSEVPATDNLVDALFQQREQGTCVLWADALCINQQDSSEKTQQIQLMAMIYRQAANVVAWLGHSDAITERALRNITKVYELAVRLDLETLREPRLFQWPYNDVVKASETFVDTLCGDLAFEEGDLGLIMSFLERPYWRRIWVIQELCLARAARLFCGRHSIQWDICEAAIGALSLARFFAETNTKQLTDSALKSLCFPYDARSPTWERTAAAHVSALFRVSDNNTLSMWDLLDYTSNNTALETLDSRDRVYALHGLLSEEDRKGVNIDLSISWEELYIKTTVHMLAQYGPRLFEYCGSAYQTTPISLPTWAVDWSYTSEREDVDPWCVRKLSNLYRFQVVERNRIVLNAAAIGHVVVIVPFSGELDDALAVTDRVEQSSRHYQAAEVQPDRRYWAWLSLLHDWFHHSVTQAIDAFFNRRLQRETSNNDVILRHDGWAEVYRSIIKKRAKRVIERMSRRVSGDMYEALKHLSPRNVFITDKGIIGWTHQYVDIQIGDVLFAFPEYGCPSVLRQQAKEHDTRTWSLVGRAFIDELAGRDDERDGGPFHLDKFWDTNPSMENITLC